MLKMNTVGYGMFSRSDNIALYANRGDTGTLVWFGRAGANKGDISVSSSAVATTPHLIDASSPTYKTLNPHPIILMPSKFVSLIGTQTTAIKIMA